MPRIFKSIHIEAPPQKVFPLAVDPAHQPQWHISLKKVEPVSGDGKSQGSAFRWTFKMGPRGQQMDSTVMDYVENQSYARHCSGDLQIQDRLSFYASQGGTRVEWSIKYTPPLGYLGVLLDAVLMNRVFQNDMETSLENLKAQAEG